MNNLSEIKAWKQNFGLLPILLNPSLGDNKYLMLNGGSGDFCLQTDKLFENPEKYFDISWSSNTKNFVVIEDNKIKIANWVDKKIEEIPKNIVETNTDKFYKYLVSKSYKTGSDVVPFILDVFRKLRNVTFEKQSPTDALNLLFQLLISIEEDYSKIDYAKWGIENVELPSQFEYFVDLINQGVKSISPNLDLILRHSSGSLFQEAHREVIYFNPQRDLFGGVLSDLKTRKEAYSSIHYTPQYLARIIVENSLKHLLPFKKSLKIFDPSCGSSEFLIEALKQLKNLGYKGKIKILGWDTSESAVNTSKFLLQYEKRTQWNGTDLEFDIRLVEDSLLEQWDNDNDLILMNPPFTSWELLKNKNSRDAILDVFGSNIKSGRPNQATAFFYKASKSLNKNGVLGCVLPTSIFTFDSYSEIRNEIKEDVSIKMIAKLGNFVFEDALTDVSFFIGKKDTTLDLPKIVWTKNEKGTVQEVLRELRKMDANNQQSIEEKKYSIYTPSDFPLIKDSWKTISLNENKLIKDIDRYVSAGNLTLMSDIFNVSQGALLGIKNIFKIPIEKFITFSKEEQILFRPVITNNSIRKGELFINEYVWFPYNKNGILVKDESVLNKLTFGKEVLIPNKSLLQSRKGISEWWSLTRPRNWQFEKETRLYSNRFGNSESFALDIKGDSVIEEGNAFLPKKVFEIDDFYFYLSFFSSNTFETLLSIYSKQLAGGNWYDLGKTQIKNISIPNIYYPSVKESDAYSKLVELGKEIEKGSSSFVKPVIDDILNNYFFTRI